MVDISKQDRDLMIRTVIGEAADEPAVGQSAVAHVIMNRVKNGSWGDTPTSVVLAPNQFEPWSTRRRELLGISPRSETYQNAARIVDDVISGKSKDPTGGADHFLNPTIVRSRTGGRLPDWAQGQPSAVIGGHHFFAPVPDLLSSWGSAPTTAQAPAGEDFLGNWKVPEPVVQAEPKKEEARAPEPTVNESARDWINRKTSENQEPGIAMGAARLGLGALRGVADVADTLGTGIAAGGRYGANALSSAGVISPETAASVGNWADMIEGRIAAGQAGFNKAAGDSALSSVGRVGGQIAATGPLLGAAGAAIEPALAGAPAFVRLPIAGAATGAGAAGLTAAASDEPLVDQLKSGAIVGGALGPAGYGLGLAGRGLRRAIFGTIDPDTALLANAAHQAGINITPGQLSSSPATRFADSVLQRLPFTGYASRTAGQQGAFNRAVSNTFGEDTPKVNTQTIRNAKDRIGRVFEDVAQRTGSINADQPFFQRMGSILSDARNVLPTAEVAPIENQMRNILQKVDPATRTLDAESYQALTRKGAPLDRAMQSKDPNIRHYAGQVREALDDAMQRSAPADAVQDLRQARSQWKALKTVEPLAKKATTGDISPALLLSKVNASYAGTGGDLGELGRIGQRFLKEPPSSGTSERLLTMKALGTLGAGALGLGGAYKLDPDNFQSDAALLLGGILGGRGVSSVLRSNALARGMINNALGRAGGRQPLANFLARTAAVPALTYRASQPLQGPVGQ